MEQRKKSQLSAVLATLACLAALLLAARTAAPSTQESLQAREKPAETPVAYAMMVPKKKKLKTVPQPTLTPLPDCVTEGTTANAAASVISHSDNHDHTWCPSFLNRTMQITFSEVSPTGFSAMLQDLPGPLTCTATPPGCSGSCRATFPQLAGQQNVPVRLENLSLSGGAFRGGRLVVGFPGGEIRGSVNGSFVVSLAAQPQGP